MRPDHRGEHSVDYECVHCGNDPDVYCCRACCPTPEPQSDPEVQNG